MKKEHMKKEELMKLKVSELKEIAKEKNIDITGLKKDEIVEKLETTLEKSEPKVVDTSFPVSGILSILDDGFGFLRNENYDTGDDNVYVSPTFIKKFRLKQGDFIEGKKRKPNEKERYETLIYIDKINYQ